jgi:hypothetical protein
MIIKTNLINSIDKLSENLTVDQVIDHIIFVEKIENGLEDSKNGKVNTKEEARLKCLLYCR